MLTYARLLRRTNGLGGEDSPLEFDGSEPWLEPWECS